MEWEADSWSAEEGAFAARIVIIRFAFQWRVWDRARATRDERHEEYMPIVGEGRCSTLPEAKEAVSQAIAAYKPGPLR